MIVKQLVILLVLATILGLVVNFISPNGLPLVGEYRELSSGEGPVIPPAAEPGDPPFIDIGQARMEFNLGTAIFIDARSYEEFECGTIPGSICLPFEYLPEGDLTHYLDSVLTGVAESQPMIVFCSGEECDVSLHLSRYLNTMNYSQVLIFFGGAREWEQFGFDIERRVDCSE